MKLKKIASGIIASAICITGNISFANEVNVKKIEEYKNKEYVASRSANPVIELGKTVTIEIPKYKDYYADITIPSKGLVAFTIKKPVELVGGEFIWVFIYDKDGKCVAGDSLRGMDWNGQSKVVYKAGMKPGKYTVVLTSSLHSDIKTKFNIGFAASENVEVEYNNDLDTANVIKTGTEYKGSVVVNDWDTYKVTLSKDTKVKIYAKETKSINRGKGLKLMVRQANGVCQFVDANYEGIAAIDMTLKKGDNYIEVSGDAALTDYAIKVSNISGPLMPEVDSIGDNSDYVTGKTQSGNKVYVKVGSKAYVQASVSSSGYFKVKTGKLKAGTVVSVYAKNSSGNSSVVKVKCVDNTAPVNPTVDKITVKSTKVTGTTEPNATVICRIDNDYLRVFEKKADSKGKYSFDIGGLSRGTRIEVQAVDTSDNYSPVTEARVENYVTAPKVNNFSNINITLSGTATKGNTVYAEVGGKSYKGEVNSAGKFSIKIPKQKYKTVLKVYAKDKSGDTSIVVSKTVGCAPKKPVVNAVTTKAVKITGESSKNAEITVKIGSKTYTGKTNSNRTFSIKIPKQKKGTEITVQAKFASTGLKSYATTIKVK